MFSRSEERKAPMPVTIKPEEVPTFSRETVSQYADIFQYQTALLRDPKRAEKEAVAYTAEDGVTDKNWGQIATGLRALAKTLGIKLAIVFKAGDPVENKVKDAEGKQVSVTTHPDARLYVKHNGAYVPLTDEEIASRKAKRIANKIESLTAQYVKEGMTQAHAEARATSEVHTSPVS
jgi:hypothetical protein